MSNVFFVSSHLETLKLKYIFAMMLSGMECWLHLKHFWKTNLNWGEITGGEWIQLVCIPNIPWTLQSVCLC